ncbi:hypothetical protein M9H77_23606 [Catharanthus roseus]|uniref:Uncharacterized protein n=1 Tax=Catharanthus roseus TaxID=4058 RepID=A0ACC0AXW9_CATRO|nr:hypothetical protein M9H77_23606 [Catharanthus roseus]
MVFNISPDRAPLVWLDSERFFRAGNRPSPTGSGYVLELRPTTTGQFRFGAIPYLTIIIEVWGSRQRKIKAAYQFFLYALLGSVFMLLAILLILLQTGTTNLQISLTTEFSERHQIFLWIASFASFAIKVPMVPRHLRQDPSSWQEFLKLGTYGFLRFSIPMFPKATLCSTPFIYTSSAIAIIYTFSTTLRQIDLKKIIAYSSVVSYESGDYWELEVAFYRYQVMDWFLQPFFCVSVLYDRHNTRLVRYYGGSVSTISNLPTIFFSSTLANMSSPGTSSFIGEFLILARPIPFGYIIVQFCGNLKPDFLHKFSDPNGREVSIFIPFLGWTALFAPAWRIASPQNDIVCAPLTVLTQSFNGWKGSSSCRSEAYRHADH